MTEATTIATLRKNARESVRVALDQYQGIDLIDVRVIARDGEAEPTLTKKGVALHVEQLPALIAVLEDARMEAVGRGLIAQAAA